MMAPGAPIVKQAPHEWTALTHGIYGCYFCQPENFPDMPDFHTLCCRCGNLIKLDYMDPMNLGMEACSTCIDELNADSIEDNNNEERGI